MRKISLVILIFIVSILSACDSSYPIKPIKEETIDFDLQTATEMIKKKEEIILEFTMREEFSVDVYEQFAQSLTKEFGNRLAQNILSMFFTTNLDIDATSNPWSNRAVNHDTFYPTIFHEGINVTSAVIHKIEYEQQFLNRTVLEITEEYVGNDEKMAGWSRGYRFIQNDDGEWEVDGFSGVMNFSGEGVNVNYLQLKQ